MKGIIYELRYERTFMNVADTDITRIMYNKKETAIRALKKNGQRVKLFLLKTHLRLINQTTQTFRHFILKTEREIQLPQRY